MPGSRRLRVAAVIATGALLVGGCGGTAGEDASGSVETPSATEGAAERPGGVTAAPPAPRSGQAAPPAAPAATASPPAIPDTVELAQPDIVVRPSGDAPLVIDEVLGMKNVDHAAAGSRFKAEFVVPAGQAPAVGAESEEPEPGSTEAARTKVSVLGVDPLAFRPLTPEVTAQEPGVWQRLLEGDVVVRHDVAQKLGLELGDSYQLVGPAGQVEARIGALASNGAPPFAEVLVPWEVATQLGAGEINLLVVSTAPDSDVEKVASNIVDRLGGGKFDLRSEPEEQRARIVNTGRHDFEPFNYTDLGDGMIVIDPNWVARWITTVELPGLGTTRCHRVMVPQLLAALREIQEAGLYGHFKPEQFGGCYMPRHIDWDPNKPLSMHAWGLAIDFNTHDNWLGQTPQMDRRVVEIFERWGFEWGGHWSRPDGMHFELDRVIDVDG